MEFVHSWFSLIVRQTGDSVMDGAVWIHIGNNIDSLMGSEAAMPAKASACMLPAWGIFLTVHSSNCSKESWTFNRY